MSKAKILLVEDDAIEAMDIKRTLELFGFEVPFVASRGEEAIEKSLEIMPDLVLMDIVLKGGVNGIGAAAEIVKLDIPVIYITAHSDEHTVEKAKFTGPYGYIIKPYDTNELKYAVELAIYKNKMEKKLKESEKRYRTIVDTANEGIWSMDPNFNTTYVNQKMAEMLGYEVEEIIGKPVKNFMFPEDLYDHEKRMKKRTKGLSETYERRFRHKDGSEVYTIVAATAFQDEKGEFAGSFAMFTDITDRMKIEEDLKNSQMQLSAILNDSPVLQFVIDKDHNVLYWNQAMAEYSGISPEEIIGTDKHWQAFYSEKRPCLADLILEGDFKLIDKWYSGKYNESEHLKGAYVAEDFFPSIGENGKWLHFTAASIKDAEGEVIGALETLEDITERKNLEKSFLDETSFNKTLIQSNPAFFVAISADGKLRMINDSMLNALGYTLDEVIGSDYLSTFVPPYDREEVSKVFESLTETKEPVISENHVLTKDKRELLVEWHGRPVFKENEFDFFIGVGLDITERKKVEESLKDSEEKFRSLTENSLDTIMLFDSDLRHLYVNPNAEIQTGIPADEFIGKTHAELGFPEDLVEIWENSLLKIFNLGKTGRIEFQLPNGGWIDWLMIPVFSDEGKVKSVITSARDITGRKHAEEALKFKNTLLEAQSESTIDGILVVDDNGKTIFFNKRFGEIWEIPQKTLDSKDDKKMIHCVLSQLKDPKGFTDKIEYLYSHKSEYSRDNVEFKDGKVFDRYSAPLITSSGHYYGRIWYFRDITDQKLYEEALKHSEAEYRAIFENIKSAVAVYNAVDNGENFIFKDFNKAAEQIEQIKREDIVGKKVTEVFPGVVEFGIFEVFQRVWKTGKPEKHPVSIYKDERIKGWRENYVYKLPSGDIVAVYDDLTEIKQYEEELEQNQIRLKSLVRILQYRAESVQDFLDYALNEAINLTESKIGYIYHYYEDKKEFILDKSSLESNAEGNNVDVHAVYKLEDVGILGEAVRQRKPLILNDFKANHLFKEGYTEGHATLHNFMTVPIFSDDEIVAVIGLANKNENYTETDILQIELLMDSVWKVLDVQQAEEALKKSETRYRAIFENTGTATVISENNMILSLVNEEFSNLTGYSKEEIENKMIWTEFFAEEELQKMEKYHRLCRIDPTSAPKSYESRIKDIEGNIKDVYISAATIPGTKKSVFSLLDITEKKQSRIKLKKELEVNRSLARIYIPIISPESTMEDITVAILEEARKLTGSKQGFVSSIDSKTHDNIVHSLSRMMPECKVMWDKNEVVSFHIGSDGLYPGLWGHCLNTKESFYTNNTEKHPSSKGTPEGHVKIEKFLGIPVLIDNEVAGEIALANPVNDYSDKDIKVVERIAEFFAMAIQRKRYEEQISTSLDEKVLLLREIHHRVKNNLQIISSILNLQSLAVKDQYLTDVFKQNQNRVKSMAMIHEKLYNAPDLAKIDFSDYLRSLTTDITYTYLVKTENIDIKLDLEDNIRLNIETAIPCGLIFGELISNSIKHAFKEGVKGKIKVGFEKIGEDLILTVSDNGSGLPDEIDFHKTESLGLQLVNSLVEQLEGSITLDKSHGTKFTIKFKELKYKQRI